VVEPLGVLENAVEEVAQALLVVMAILPLLVMVEMVWLLLLPDHQ